MRRLPWFPALAFAAVAALLVACPEEPRAVWTPRVPAGVDRFAPVVHRTPSFVYRTRAELDLAPAARRVEEVRREIRTWLGYPDEQRTPPTTALILETREEVYAVEAWVGGSWSRDPRRIAFNPAAGGFYPTHNLIALETEIDDELDGRLAHEGAHATLNEVAPWLPDPINEGLAVIAEYAVLAGRTSLLAGPTPPSEGFEFSLWKTVRYRDEPRLRTLFELDHFEFRDPGSVSFSLSWALASLLLRTEAPELRDRLPDLLARYTVPTDAWSPVVEVYPLASLESAWRIEVERLAARMRKPSYVHAARGRFEILSWGQVPAKRLVSTMQTVHERVRAWLGKPDSPFEPPILDVYVLFEADDVARVQHGLDTPVEPTSWRLVGKRPPASARRLPVVLHHVGRERLLWDAACLAARVVLELEAPELPTPLLEGLVLQIAQWCTHAPDRPFGEHARAHAELDAIAAQARDEAPSLDAFFALDDEQYRNGEHVEYALAWCLVDVLVASDNLDVRRRFRDYVAAKRERRGTYEDLLAALPGVDLETPWRARLAGLGK